MKLYLFVILLFCISLNAQADEKKTAAFKNEADKIINLLNPPKGDDGKYTFPSMLSLTGKVTGDSNKQCFFNLAGFTQGRGINSLYTLQFILNLPFNEKPEDAIIEGCAVNDDDVCVDFNTKVTIKEAKLDAAKQSYSLVYKQGVVSRKIYVTLSKQADAFTVSIKKGSDSFSCSNLKPKNP